MKKAKRISYFICAIVNFIICFVSIWEQDYSQATFFLILGIAFIGLSTITVTVTTYNIPYDEIGAKDEDKENKNVTN